jgi:hypothetical protein
MPWQVIMREPQSRAESSARGMEWLEERGKVEADDESSFDIGH